MAKIIPQVEEATTLSAKDQFLFYSNTKKKTMRVSRDNMLGSPGVASSIPGVSTVDSTAPNLPQGLILTSSSSIGNDGKEDIIITAKITPNADADLEGYSWYILEIDVAPVFSGGILTSGGTSSQTPTYEKSAKNNEGGYAVKVFRAVKANKWYLVKVAAVDKSGNYSSYTATNTQNAYVLTTKDSTPPGSPALHGTNHATNPSNSAIKSVFLRWTNPSDSDLARIDIYRADGPTFTTYNKIGSAYGTAWTDSSSVQGTAYRYKLKAVDYSGNESAFSTVSPDPGGGIDYVQITPGQIETTDVKDFAVTTTKRWNDVIVLEGDSWTDSVATNTISWNQHSLYYKGTKYTVASGSVTATTQIPAGTGDKVAYVYATIPVSGTSITYNTYDVTTEGGYPTLSNSQFMIATNVNGAHDLAWNALANAVVGSAWIQNASITTAKVKELSADKITAGTIDSDTIILGESGGSQGIIKSSGATSAVLGTGFWIQGGAAPVFAIGVLSGAPSMRFSGGALTVKGRIEANEGFFGPASTNGVQIDSLGLSIVGNNIGGENARLRANLEWNNSANSGNGGFTGTNGFYLGKAGTSGGNPVYRFFIGNTGTDGLGTNGDNLFWNGNALIINGSLGGNIRSGTGVGTNANDVGLLMNTQYGIRRSVDDGTLTLTGGNGNGIYYGAQIDLVGSVFKQGADLSGDDGSGTVQISAGYRKLTSPNWYDGPLDGAIVFRTLREENDQDDETDVIKAAHSGAQRFRIELDGTVRVVYTGNASLSTDYGKVHRNDVARNSNPGRFIVEGQTSAKNVTIKNGQISVGTNEIVNASGVVTITGGSIDGTSTISGTTASTLVNNAANVANKLNKNSADILSAAITVENAGGFKAGTITWDANGVVTAGTYGVAMTSGGIVGYKSLGANLSAPSFSISSFDGSAIFAGELSAPSGNIGGWNIDAAALSKNNIVIDSTGSIRSGKTSYTDDTNGGFWIGNTSSGNPVVYTGKLNVGNADAYIKWTGSEVQVKGNITATSITLTSAGMLQPSDVDLGNVQNLTAQGQAQTGIGAGITINTGGITMSTGGYVQGGIEWTTDKFTPNDANSKGFFLGYVGSQYRLFIGQPGTTGLGGTNYLHWDGTNLDIKGRITATAITLSGGVTIPKASVGLGNVENLTPQDQTNYGLEATVDIDQGGIKMSAGGFIKGGIDWTDTPSGKFINITGGSSKGFFLGYSGSQYRLFIGEIGSDGLGAGGKYLHWNGSELQINGQILGTSTINGTSASTVVSNAANGQAAWNALPNKLDDQAVYILGDGTGNTFSLKTTNFDSGTGVGITENGIICKKAGTNTVTITNTGDATFAGELSAPTGTIGGWIINSSDLKNTTVYGSSGTIGLVNQVKNLILGADASQIYPWPNLVNHSNWTMIATTNLDDGSGQIQLPFPFYINGVPYTSLYVGTNTYITFGAGSSNYGNINTEGSPLNELNPPHTKFHLGSADNSWQRVGWCVVNSGTTNDYVLIRYEGNAATGGTPGSPSVPIIYEIKFFNPNRIFNGLPTVEFVVGSHARTNGAWGIYSSTQAIDYLRPVLKANNSYVFQGTSVQGYTFTIYSGYSTTLVGAFSTGINTNYANGAAFYAGSMSSNAFIAPFQVSHYGELKATNAIISGSITASSLTLKEGVTIGNANIASGVDKSKVGLGSVENLAPQGQAQTGLRASVTISTGGISMTGPAFGENAPFIAGGKTSYNSIGTGFFMGFDSSTPKLTVGTWADVSGTPSLTKGISWDGSTFLVLGEIKTGSTIDNTVTVSGTALSTIISNAANGNTAYNNLTNKLNKNASDILTGVVQVQTAGGFVAGNLVWTESNGTISRTSGKGVAMTSNGIVGYNNAGEVTFAIKGDDGSATFKGNISGSNGSFAGTLSGVTGDFTGTVNATAGYFGTSLTNGVKVDSAGLELLGSGASDNVGRIKAAIDWNHSNSQFTPNTNGFYLGRASNVYRFFIGSTGGTGLGGTNYLYWDGSNLKIGGKIVGGTSIESAPSGTTDGLIINSTIGIRKGNQTGTLTITGGDSNGISAGAQIDFGGNELGNGNRGILILQGGSAGPRVGESAQDALNNGRIEFRTNTYDGTVGVTRARFSTSGEFVVYKNSNNSIPGVYTTGAGCAEFQANVGIGRTFETINSSGNTPGKLHVQTEIALYGSNNAQKVLLTKTGTNTNEGVIYIKNNAGTTKVTLDASTGDVAADSFTTSSSRKFKTKIKSLNNGMEIIEKLKPVSFKRKGKNGKNDIGLIAEEVDKILPTIVKHNDKNEAEGLDYSKLTVVLINAVKELSAEVKELKKKLKDANSN